MEDIAPPLDLANFVRVGLEQGDSVKICIQSYLSETKNEMWRGVLARWLLALQNGKSTSAIVQAEKSHIRRSLLQVLEHGYHGSAIHPQLCMMEAEIKVAAARELDQFCAKIPFLAMLPLFLFQFPAFLAVLLGPFLVGLI